MRLMMVVIISLILFICVTYAPILYAKELISKLHKWYVILNPLPITITDVVLLNLSFPYGKAYNGTLVLLDDEGLSLPFSILSAKYYSNTSFYKECLVAVPLELKPLSTFKLEIRTSDRFHKVEIPPLEHELTVSIDNETGDIIVENNYYLIHLANSSRGLYRLILKSLGNWSIVEEDWPSLSFVIMFKNYTMLTQLDIDDVELRVVYNSSLLALIEYIFRSPVAIIHQSYLFNALNSRIVISTRVEILDGEDIRNIYLYEIKFSRGNVSAIYGPLTTIELPQESTIRSLMPSPRWLCFNVINCSLMLSKVSSDVNITESLIRFLNASRLLNLKSKLLMEKYNLVLYNYTNLWLNNLTDYLWELHKHRNLIEMALLNSLVRYHNYTNGLLEKRDVFMCDNYVVYAVQVNETTVLNASEFMGKVVLEVLPQFSSVDELRSYSWRNYVNYIKELPILELPIEVDTLSLQEIMVDDLATLNLTVISHDFIKNLTIALVNNTYVKLEQGNYTIALYDLEPNVTQSYSWIVSLLREGVHDLKVSVFINNYTVCVARSINVTLPPLLPKAPTSVANLTIRCVDLNNTPIINCAVSLFRNETKELIGVYTTNETGYVTFYNLSLGMYTVIVNDGTVQISKSIQLYRNEHLNVVLDKLFLEIKTVNKRGVPLKDVHVSIRDDKGRLIFAGITDEDGVVYRYGILVGNYTVTFKWKDFILKRVSVSLMNYTKMTVMLDMYYLTVRAVRDNKTLAGALVTIMSKEPYFYEEKFVTGSDGEVKILLPSGRYDISVSKGQYVGGLTITLNEDLKVTIRCETTNALFIIMGVTGALWLCYGVLWRRYTSVAYKEREKYRKLLARLEELYKEGLVEEKLYQKLKSEYENKLREVGG